MTEIDVPNADGELSPGTYCTVELKIPRRTPSLIVPAGAIVFDRDGLHVLVAENGVARSRKITEIRDLGSIQRAPDGSAAPSFSGIQTPRLQRLRSRLPNEKRLHAPMIAERVCINAGQRFAQAGTTSPRRMMPI
jgi:hypothetical protein